ncbi:MAG: cytochrome c, partial [Planctomycetota bacterium]
MYLRVCANCHGTHDQPGSLPTSLRFATGSFKNGSDPHQMYQTLTHGFGLMVAQRWMVPTQKYDVIHYIREEYVAKSNPSQYRPVTDAYLDALPKGSDRGPSPVSLEPWVTMDYGQSLSATYEVGDDGSVFAHKGIAIRLDSGPGGVARGREWVVYDHDTMRLAGYWAGTGFIDWQGILFDGKHAVHPRVVGEVMLCNPTGPGWADPETGSFDDRRVLGRDGRQYGPLPREWARFRGMYVYGERRILEYSVGAMKVLESPLLVPTESGNALVREMLLQPSGKETPGMDHRESTSLGGKRNAHRTVAIARLPTHGPLTSLETDHPGSKAVLIDLSNGTKFAAGVVGAVDAKWEI